MRWISVKEQQPVGVGSRAGVHPTGAAGSRESFNAAKFFMINAATNNGPKRASKIYTCFNRNQSAEPTVSSARIASQR